MKTAKNDRLVDLRSDTLSQPTAAMREAMAAAVVGDEQYGEDPTVNRLQEMAAALLGKEAALFVNSGTMGNLLAALAHCAPGDEIILEASSHQVNAEAANLAFVGGFMVRPLQGKDGILEPEAIENAIRTERRVAPRTGLIAIENTHNSAGGVVIPPANLEAIGRLAREKSIPLFIDGARLFNAAIALDIDVRELVAPVDSVTFCLSKGLSCPAGSILVGTRAFIDRASRFKQMLGGYMRQTGILAAAGIVALESMIGRLAEDHHRARCLGNGVAQIEGLCIDLNLVQTNLVFFELERSLNITATRFIQLLEQAGVKCRAVGPRRIRMVTYQDISEQDIDYTVQTLADVVAACQD